MKKKLVERIVCIVLTTTMLVGSFDVSVLANNEEKVTSLSEVYEESDELLSEAEYNPSFIDMGDVHILSGNNSSESISDCNIDIDQDNGGINIAWSYYNNEVEIFLWYVGEQQIDYEVWESLYKSDLVIPSIIDGKRVTRIDRIGENLKQFTGGISIADSVTYIGEYAFNETNFAGELKLPKNLRYIGDYAFAGTYFSGNLKLPNYIDTIGENAFAWTHFTGVLTIPGDIQLIDEAAFCDCNELEEVKITGNVEQINSIAFSFCDSLISLDITGSVSSIGDSAFRYSCLETVSLGNAVLEIGDHAFQESKYLKAIDIPDSVKTIGKEAFAGCSAATSLNIGSGVRDIKEGAFKDCVQITGGSSSGPLIIPASVQTIGKEAFSNCKALSCKLELHNGLKEIGEKAFYMCSALTGDLTIPASVKAVGDNAFNGCSGFDGDLTIEGGSIGEYAFANCKGFSGELVLSDNITSIGDYAFNNCSSFTGSLVLPRSLNSIGNNVFQDCKKFTGVLTIPGSYTTIGEYAFAGCNGLTGLIIEEGVAEIKEFAFNSCNVRAGVTIPDSVTTIGTGAFSGAVNDKTGVIKIGKGVTSIGSNAFANCVLRTMYITSNVTDIGSGAFYNLKPLSTSDCYTVYCYDDTYDVLKDRFQSATSSEYHRLNKFSQKLKVNFDANNGQCSLETLDYYGKIDNLPTATYEGAVFAGWYTDKIGGKKVNVGDSFGLETEITLYARYLRGCTDFEMGKDTFGFKDPNNDEKRFWDNKYSDVLKVNLSKSDRKTVDNLINHENDNGGWCYGLCVAMAQFYNGFHKSTDYYGDTLYDVPHSSNIHSLITYYYLTQNIKEMIQAGRSYGIDNMNCTQERDFGTKLVSELRKGNLSLVNFMSTGRSHAVLAFAIDETTDDNNYIIYCADPSALNKMYINERNQKVELGVADNPTYLLMDKKTLTFARRGDGGISYIMPPYSNGSARDSIKLDSVESVISDFSVFEDIVEGDFKARKYEFEILQASSSPIIAKDKWGNSVDLSHPIYVSRAGEGDNNEIVTYILDKKDYYEISSSSDNKEQFYLGFDNDKVYDVSANADTIVFDKNGKVEIGGAIGESIITTSVEEDDKDTTASFRVSANNICVEITDDGYELSSDDNIGTVYISINGEEEEEFVAEQTLTYDLSMHAVIVGGDKYEYTGAPIIPKVEVYDQGIKLTENIDYKVTYKNNTKSYLLADKNNPTTLDKKNAPQIIVQGKGNYQKSDIVYFDIEPRNLGSGSSYVDGLQVTIDDKAFTDKRNESKPTVKYGKVTLREKTDYDLEFSDADNTISKIGTVEVAIKGKNNFAGTITTSYRIYDKAKDFSKLYFAPIESQEYTGSEIKPEVVVKNAKTDEEAIPSENFDIKYDKNTDAGTATVIIRGKAGGLYESHGKSKSLTFKITQKTFTNSNVSISLVDGDPVFNGAALKPAIEVRDKDTDRIIPPDCYSVAYSNNTVVPVEGTADNKLPTIKITGKKNYKGTATVKFNIEPLKVTTEDGKADTEKGLSVSLADVKEKNEITAKDIKPVVKLGKKTLTNGKDYDVSFSRVADKSVMTQSAQITFKGNYSGVIDSVPFIIYSAASKANTLDVSISKGSFVYTGKKIEPPVTVTTIVQGDSGEEEITLIEGRDYKVTYSNNLNVANYNSKSAPSVKITGMGAYSGSSDPIQFSILRKELTKEDITVTVEDILGAGKAVKPKYTVIDNSTGKALATSNYSVAFSNNINVSEKGEAGPKLLITGKGNYKTADPLEYDFRIYKTSISGMVFEKITNLEYTGKQIRPDGDLVAIYKDRTKNLSSKLTEGKDYTLSYSTNINAGAGKVIVTGIGEYGGTKTVSFTIVPRWLKWLLL